MPCKLISSPHADFRIASLRDEILKLRGRQTGEASAGEAAAVPVEDAPETGSRSGDAGTIMLPAASQPGQAVAPAAQAMQMETDEAGTAAGGIAASGTVGEAIRPTAEQQAGGSRQEEGMWL